MMVKQKKDSKPMSLRMDSVTFNRLQSYCNQSGQSKTIAIERAVNKYIDEYDARLKKLETLES